MPNELDEKYQQLKALVGKWQTKGKTRETADSPSIIVDATDTYEELPGKRGLLHTVDAGMGDGKVEGAEIIGYDPERQAYVTQYFGTDGPNAYEAHFSHENGALVWEMASARDRFKGTFKNESFIDGHWELLDEQGNWQPWMDITLTKDTD